MYAQSYRPPAINIPERYDGTALETAEAQNADECADECSTGCPPHQSEEPRRPHHECDPPKRLPQDGHRGILDLPFGGWLGNLFGNANIGLHTIGLEEIILAAAALYLFLSKDGDKECAIILAILLFVN